MENNSGPHPWRSSYPRVSNCVSPEYRTASVLGPKNVIVKQNYRWLSQDSIASVVSRIIFDNGRLHGPPCPQTL